MVKNQKSKQRNKKAVQVSKSVNEIKNLPRWTHEELGYLMQLCADNNRSWEERVSKMIQMFGDDHEPYFFNIETCQEKYKRLNGESQGKPVDDELHKWIQEYLKKSMAETCGKPELVKLAKAQRLYEYSKLNAANRFTIDQMVELSGIDSVINYLSEKVVESESENREHWLNADLINSRISSDDWKNFGCLKDLLKKIYEVIKTPVNESKLVFRHDSLELHRTAQQEVVVKVEYPAPVLTKEPKVEEVVSVLPVLPKPQQPRKSVTIQDVSPILPKSQQPRKCVTIQNVSPILPKSQIQKSRKSVTNQEKNIPILSKTRSGPTKLIKLESPKKGKLAKKRNPEYKIHKAILSTVHNSIVNFSSNHFKEPVVFLEYTNIIKKPMDLKTIGKMIEKEKITNLMELRDAYFLMCTNAIIFNPDGHLINKEARKLKKFCEETVQEYISPIPRNRKIYVKPSLYF